jgi:hypothetical protein
MIGLIVDKIIKTSKLKEGKISYSNNLDPQNSTVYVIGTNIDDQTDKNIAISFDIKNIQIGTFDIPDDGDTIFYPIK